jgi:hypothetical protein
MVDRLQSGEREAAADGSSAERDSWLHDSSLDGERNERGEDPGGIGRGPLEASDSRLVSRDYRPLQDGPSLITSWPVGIPPTHRGSGEHWEITDTEWTTLQRNVLSAPHLAPLDRSPTYLVVCGRGHVDDGEVLEIRLDNRHLSGKPYETTLEIAAEDSVTFTTPTVEFTPDRGVYEGSDARHYPEYSLEATVTGGTGYVNAGTNVQLWSE